MESFDGQASFHAQAKFKVQFADLGLIGDVVDSVTNGALFDEVMPRFEGPSQAAGITVRDLYVAQRFGRACFVVTADLEVVASDERAASDYVERFVALCPDSGEFIEDSIALSEG